MTNENPWKGLKITTNNVSVSNQTSSLVIKTNKKVSPVPCLACQLDQFFRISQDLGDGWSHENNPIDLLKFDIRIFYDFISVCNEMNLAGILTPDLFLAENVNSFLVGYLAQNRFIPEMSGIKLKKTYATFKKLITFFAEKNYIKMTDKELFFAHLLPFKDIKIAFLENQLEYSKIFSKQIKNNQSKKVKSGIYSREDYIAALRLFNQRPEICTKFSYELADGYRRNFATEIVRFAPDLAHFEHELAIFMLFAFFGEQIAKDVFQLTYQFEELKPMYMYNLVKSNLFPLIFECNIFPYLYDIVFFFYQGLEIFLTNSCKDCNYICLLENKK